MVMPNSPYPIPNELFEKNLIGKLRIKLIDFGSALKIMPDEDGKQKLSDDHRKNLIYSLFYRAPELFITTIADEVNSLEIIKINLMIKST